VTAVLMGEEKAGGFFSFNHELFFFASLKFKIFLTSKAPSKREILPLKFKFEEIVM
jgi:hypothetical protein